MRFSITHRTEYRYSRPVFLEPTIFRLRPRCDVTQTLETYSIVITPSPAGTAPSLDNDGHCSDTAWFVGTHTALTIDVTATVLTRRQDPFAFLITDPGALFVPVNYSAGLRAVLQPYLTRSSRDTAVASFANETRAAVKNDTVQFLSTLALRIHTDFEYCQREQGAAHPAGETLKTQSGACRDFALLYMEVCRYFGIAARFVSGYHFPVGATEFHLHAWVEVYLPGAGWRGFDPSEGLAVADRHIALAAGPTPDDASPIQGLYRGTDVTPTLTASLAITALDNVG